MILRLLSSIIAALSKVSPMSYLSYLFAKNILRVTNLKNYKLSKAQIFRVSCVLVILNLHNCPFKF